MTFMLGAFAQGLTQGAKDVYGLYDMASVRNRRDAETEATRQDTAMRKEAADAAKSLVLNQPTNTPKPALDVTPSNSGVAGGGPGTTTNGPVAPLNFDTAVPQPAYMPQSAPGSPSGFDPNRNPEAGPVSAAASIGAPMPQVPNLASGTDRTTPTGLGGAGGPSAYQAPQVASNNPMLGQPPAAPRPPLDLDKPLLQQTDLLPHVDMDKPLLKQFGSSGDSPPSPSAPDGKVHNRPVGTALKDWWRGTNTPDQPMTHGKDKATAKNLSNDVGRHLAGALKLGSN